MLYEDPKAYVSHSASCPNIAVALRKLDNGVSKTREDNVVLSSVSDKWKMVNCHSC